MLIRICLGVLALSYATAAFGQTPSVKFSAKDFAYLWNAANMMEERDLSRAEQDEKYFRGTVKIACDALSRLSKDENFAKLLDEYNKGKMDDKSKQDFFQTLENLDKFLMYIGDEAKSFEKGGLSGATTDEALGMLVAARLEIMNFEIDPEKIRNAIASSAGNACKISEGVTIVAERGERRRKSEEFKRAVISGTIMTIDGVFVGATYGLTLISIIGGAYYQVYGL